MLNDLRHTVKHIVIYSLGNVSSKLIGFILLPLYTSYLTVGEYGTLAIIEVTGLLITALFGLKLSTAMMRWCSAGEKSNKIGSIVFTILIVTLALVLILNLILQPLSTQFSNLLFNTSEYKDYFHILFLLVSFEILNILIYDLVRLKGKPGFYVLISISKFTTILLLNIFFVKYQGLGVKGIILSQLLGNILMTLLTFKFLIKNIKPEFIREEIIPMAKYGFPLVFSALSMLLVTMGDRYLLKYLKDLSDVGIYTLGYKIATVINLLIIQSFQTGFLPIAYKKYEQANSARFFSKTLTYYTFILILTGLAISLFSKEIIELLARDKDYLLAYTIVPFITLSFVFKGIQYVFSLSLHFVKKTKFNAYIVILTAIFNIGLNFLLIPKFGIYGAAVSSVMSWLFMVSFFRIYARKFYDPGYETGKIILLVMLGLILYLVSLLFTGFPFVLVIILKLLLIFSFPFILYILKFYEAIEIEQIKGIWKKWHNPTQWPKNIRNLRIKDPENDTF